MVASTETVELWCGDCADDACFEVVPGEGSAREYACVSCGAAYLEVLVEPVPVGADARGAA